jgi:hypothetical protein
MNGKINYTEYCKIFIYGVVTPSIIIYGCYYIINDLTKHTIKNMIKDVLLEVLNEKLDKSLNKFTFSKQA